MQVKQLGWICIQPGLCIKPAAIARCGRVALEGWALSRTAEWYLTFPSNVPDPFMLFCASPVSMNYNGNSLLELVTLEQAVTRVFPAAHTLLIPWSLCQFESYWRARNYVYGLWQQTVSLMLGSLPRRPNTDGTDHPQLSEGREENTEQCPGIKWGNSLEMSAAVVSPLSYYLGQGKYLGHLVGETGCPLSAQ